MGPWGIGNDFENAISEPMLRVKSTGSSCEIILMWMPHNTFEDESILVKAMALCRHAIKPSPNPMFTLISVAIWRQ